MGFFSDPATQPDAFLLDSSEELEAPAKKTSKRRSIKEVPRRMKSLDTTIPEGAPPLPTRGSKRRPGRRMSLSHSNSSGGSRRPSDNSSSMADHLGDIEAFCRVLNDAGEAQRNKILKESLLAQAAPKSKRSQRRTSMR